MLRFVTILYLTTISLATLWCAAFAGWMLKRRYTFLEEVKKNPLLEKFNVSIINGIPEKTTISVLIFLGVLFLVIIAVGISLRKKSLWAKVLLGIIFLFILGITLFSYPQLKAIENYYFWKSPYVKMYFYTAAPILITSFLFLMFWVVNLVKKK